MNKANKFEEWAKKSKEKRHSDFDIVVAMNRLTLHAGQKKNHPIKPHDVMEELGIKGWE